MRLVSIKSLEPGHELARPLYTSNGKVVLNSGTTLTEAFINKIQQIGVNKVYIVDERFSDIEISQPLDFSTRVSVTKVLTDNYVKVHNSKSINEYEIKDAAQKIVDYTRENRSKGMSILATDAVNEYVIEHSVNVAILTAFIGSQMLYNFGQLCDLVTGALIHDIGRINDAEEKPDHVNIGFEAVRVCRGFSLHSTKVCYEHHENYNGSGYPRKIKGNDISEFSRVIRVADYYDNVLHGYEDNNTSVMPHQAFEGILAVAGQVLDPEIIERFRDTVVFYPNGSTVLLSNGLNGVVVKQNIGSPHRPIVRVFNDSGVIGNIDLLKSLTLFVQEVILV